MSSADARSAAGSSASAFSAAAFRPVADDQLPRTAVAEPSLLPLGVPARLLHAAAPGASASRAAPASTAALVSDLAGSGIPIVALKAYKNSARRMATTDPGCRLSWPLLAGIGRVESNHGRFGGAELRADGTSTQRIIGIPLNGHGTALIRDTDHGVLDGDTVYDRAVGPMQFIPSTWRSYGSDGNGDGRADPFNILDAALATARYLCVAGGDLGTPAGQQRAILTYNDSTDYLRLVLAMAHDYATGTAAVIPVLPATAGTPGSSGGGSSGSAPSRRASSTSSAPRGRASSSSSHRSGSSAPPSRPSSSRPSSSKPSSSKPSSSKPTTAAPTSSAPSSSGSTSAKPTPSCSTSPSTSSSTTPAPTVTSTTSPASSGTSLSASGKTSSAASSGSSSPTDNPSSSPTSCG